MNINATACNGCNSLGRLKAYCCRIARKPPIGWLPLPDGRVDLRLRRDGDQATIEVEDNGRGMSETFIRDKLFTPFQSTKAHGMGIGAFESREYLREIGGSLEVRSKEGAGTMFRIRLPLAMGVRGEMNG